MSFTPLLRTLACCGLLMAGAAQAQDPGATALTLTAMPVGYAASSYQSPVAFGGSWGSASVAAMKVWGQTHEDGSIAAAFGLGNPDTVGLDTAVVISSLSKSRGGEYGLGEEGSFAFKLHRNLGDYTAIALGANAIGRWGGDVFMDKNPQGHYLALTRAVFVGDCVLMLSGGLGDDVAKGTHGVDVFGSAALYVTHWASVIVEHNGFSTNAALSLAPLPRWLPLTVTAGLVDLETRHNDKIRVVGMVGLGFHF